MSRFIPSRYAASSLVPVVFLSVILTLSLYLRSFGFYLPHTKVDEMQYLALAMKLETSGFDGYNLRGIDIRQGAFSVFLEPAEPGKTGNFFAFMPNYNKSEEMNLFNKPPLLPLSLALSHKLFAGEKAYEIVATELGPAVKQHRPPLFFRTQFYAVVIPLLCSLLLIMTTFVLGRVFFGSRAGLYAAALVAFSPIELLVSQKVLTDDMVAFLFTSAVLMYFLARSKGSVKWAVIGGIFFGFSVLAKSSGNLLLLVIVVYEAWEMISRKISGKMLLDKFALILPIFLIPAFVVSLPWHILILKNIGIAPLITTWGKAYYNPLLLVSHPYGSIVLNRSWFMFPVNIPAQTPLLVLMYVAIPMLLKRREKLSAEEKQKWFLLFTWAGIFLVCLLNPNVPRELRYMLPAYPAIAVISAETLETIRKRIDATTGHLLGTLLMNALFFLSLWWSISLGLKHLFANSALIIFPL